MAGVRFGMFDWIDRRDAPLTEIYAQRLDLIAAGEDAGFFCYHLAEHHATPLGMAPSPALFLAAAATRTHRIRLGPLVFLLPLYEPLRLIEEVCMLDHLTGGRLELGVGRGVSPWELGYHGVDASRSRAMFQEALAVLVAGLSGERLTHSGQFYTYDDVPLELRPLQRPYPPLWYATTVPESVRWAAAHGINLAQLGPAEAVKANVDLYHKEWEAHRHEPGRMNGHVTEPALSVNRQLVLAETDEEALVLAQAAHPRWAHSFIKLWQDHGDHTYDHRVRLDTALGQETIIAGAPNSVRDAIARLVQATGVSYVNCAFAWGSLTHEQALRSLTLFAREVMPAFTESRPGKPG